MPGTASVGRSMAMTAATASTAMEFCTRGTARNSTRTPDWLGNIEDHSRGWLPHDYARDTTSETSRTATAPDRGQPPSCKAPPVRGTDGAVVSPPRAAGWDLCAVLQTCALGNGSGNKEP